MGALISYSPGGTGPGSIARLVWQASQALLFAVRTGQRDAAARVGPWMVSMREDPRCTGPLARTIDRALEIALRQFGGAAPTFEPVQPSDGEAA